MIALTNDDLQLQQLTSRMRHTWFIWGLVPLGLSIVITLFVAALATAEVHMTDMALERRFQLLLAIGAGLFLIGFSLDRHWTGSQKLAKRLAIAAGVGPDKDGKWPKLTARQAQSLGQFSNLVYESILSSVQALTIIGAAIAVVAILAAGAHLGLSYAIMMLMLAAAYQLFVFSRHSYYREVMSAAADGRLLVEQEETA